MKRILALAAVLLPLYLFAQGFGSFSHDQPYLAGGVVSADSITNIPDLFLDFDASRGVTTVEGGPVSGSFITNIVEQQQNWPNSVFYNDVANRLRWIQDGANPTNTYFQWTNNALFGCGISATNSGDLVGTNYTWFFVARVDNQKIASGGYLYGTFDATGLNLNAFGVNVTNQFRPWTFAAYDTTNSFVDDKWFVMTVSVTNGMGYFKVNGNMMQISGLPAQDWPWVIGSYRFAGIYGSFPGDMTRVLLWKRHLSSNEVYQVETALLNQYQIAPFVNSFDPATVAGLKVWLKSDSGVVANGEGGNVWKWFDQSGNSNNFFNENGESSTNYANGPAIGYTLGPRGLPRISFTSGHVQRTNAPLSLNQPNTYFVVANHPFNTTSKFLFDSTDTDRNAFFDTTDGFLYADPGAIVPHLNFSRYYTVMTFVFNGAASLFRTNGSVVASPLLVGPKPMGKMIIGAAIDTSANWTGEIEEVLVYNAAITGTDLTNIERYLFLRYGLLFE